MKITIRLSLILSVLAGVSLGWKSWETKTSAQQLEQTVQFDFPVETTARELGVLQSANTIKISSSVPGESAIVWLIENGQSVKKGDLLAQLDDSVFDEQIEQVSIEGIRTEADREEAETLLKKAVLEKEFHIKQATEKVKEAKLLIDRNDRGENDLGLELSRMSQQAKVLKQKIGLIEAALKAPDLTGAERLENQLRLLDFQTEQSAVLETLEHLETREAPRQKQLLQAQLELAQHTLKIGQLEQQVRVDQATAELSARETTANIVREKLEQLKRDREGCRIVAPRDGIVLHYVQSARRTADNPMSIGATVREQQVLFTMPDFNQLQVRVKVHETRISQIKTGQSATLIFDALPEDRYAGKVLSIADSPLPGTWPNTDLKQYEVLVSLPKPDSKLKLGMTCVAEIQIAE